jgi:hypothetical protein
MFSRAFLESLTIALPDGRYVVRPNGRWGRSYLVDRPTRDRLIRFQQVYGWLAVVAMAFGCVPVKDRLFGSTLLFVALLGAALYALAMIGTCIVVRGAESLPKEASAQDFAVIRSQLRAQRSGKMHAMLYWALMIASIGLAIFFTLVCLGLAFLGSAPSIALLADAVFFAAMAAMIRGVHKPR